MSTYSWTLTGTMEANHSGEAWAAVQAAAKQLNDAGQMKTATYFVAEQKPSKDDRRESES